MIKQFIAYTKQHLKLFSRKSKKPDRATATEDLERQPVASPLETKAAARDSATRQSPGQSPAPKPGKPGRRKRPQSESAQASWDPASFEVTPLPGKSRFHDFALPPVIMHGIADLQFQYCTPIQEKALPVVLEGRDLIGKANTGTGKSAVFLIATLSRLLGQEDADPRPGRPRALVIAPTRELVIQIAKDGEDLGRHTGLSIIAVYGGVDYEKQMDALSRNRADIVVATPGRLLDFCWKSVVALDQCRILVIDEADRMLDMGFIPDVRRIIGRMPGKEKRQTMLFSATITGDVQRLASQWCTKPTLAEIEEEEVSAENVEQVVYLVSGEEKYNVLYNLLIQRKDDRILIFANQKHEARKLCDRLRRNSIDSALLTGDVPQAKRTQRLESFRSGKVKVLVATDVAGRGIHIDDITHVVNYTLPYEPEDYVHRIGRTGRAGASGTAISFACEQGGFYMPAIEEFIGRSLECVVPDDSLLVEAPKGTARKEMKQETSPRERRSRSSRRRSGGQRRTGG